MYRIVFYFCFYSILFSAFNDVLGQEPVQTIRGKVLDRSTLAPLEGASVVLEGYDSSEGTVTDSSGYFNFNRIKAGRYTLTVSYLGYHTRIVPELLLIAGKEMILEVALAKKMNPLDEVTIIADMLSSDDPLEINYLSSRKFTVEESQRYAATFYDPARVVLSGPGIVATNDQANHLAVRGNNPNNLLWLIEGAEVVNPNHLTNAGTVSDKPSLSGGGVAIISTQLMADSKFLTGAFPAGYGNVLSGVFDIRLKDGNNRQYEYTAQASLLGIDVAAEGPFADNYSGSFIVNYRYSTLGLFAMAGIPIGDETINFQDLSVKATLPAGKLGKFNLFAIGGKSTTVFTGSRDSSEWIYQKDRTDVDFYSDMGAAGISHKVSTGDKSGIHSAIVVSGLVSGRTELQILQYNSTVLSERHKLSLVKKSFSGYYFNKLNNAILLKAGAVISSNNFRIQTETFASQAAHLKKLHDGDAGYTTFQPYLHWQQQVTSKFQLDIGLHSLIAGFNKNSVLEPRVSGKLQVSTKSYLTAGYGLHSRMQHPSVYFNSIAQNEGLEFTKAHHSVAGFNSRIKQNLVFNTEIYYQWLYNVPVLAERSGSFSVLNLPETSVITERLANEGTGKNYGVDVSLERLMNKGFYFILAGSLYESLYKGSDGIERNTRYNGKHSAKVTAGKEFEVQKENEINVFGINVSAVNAGGFRYTPDSDSLMVTGSETMYTAKNAFSGQLDDFFRLDLRLLWRKNKAHYTRTFAMDIQNVTNRKNPAWPYFDSYQNKIVFKNQLGILPFLSYRIEF